jgi:hypothetical protein
VKLLEEKHRERMSRYMGNELLLSGTSIVQEIRKRIDIWDCIKLKASAC